MGKRVPLVVTATLITAVFGRGEDGAMAAKSRRMTFASRFRREPLTTRPSDRGVGGYCASILPAAAVAPLSAAAGPIHERGEREGGCW